jgi:multicomponent Na+:H+ antiporter subunit E
MSPGRTPGPGGGTPESGLPGEGRNPGERPDRRDDRAGEPEARDRRAEEAVQGAHPESAAPGAPYEMGVQGRIEAMPRLSRRDVARNQAIAMTGLVVVWCLLWGSFTPANVIGGLVLAVIVLAVFPLPPVTYAGRVSPVGLVWFVAHFLYDLAVSSVQVAMLALRFGRVPRNAVIAVPLRVPTDLNLTLTGVALSLVPGSLVIEVDRAAGVLYIHVLGVNDLDEVERFRRGVYALEERIIAAIGSEEERRVIATSRGAAGLPPGGGRGPSA